MFNLRDSLEKLKEAGWPIRVYASGEAILYEPGESAKTHTYEYVEYTPLDWKDEALIIRWCTLQCRVLGHEPKVKPLLDWKDGNWFVKSYTVNMMALPRGDKDQFRRVRKSELEAVVESCVALAESEDVPV